MKPTPSIIAQISNLPHRVAASWHSHRLACPAFLLFSVNFVGFTLLANTNLNTNIWDAISPPYAVSGTNNVVTNATTEALKFYRLSKP